MGKKRRNKKTKQEKQSHEPDDSIPINTSSSGYSDTSCLDDDVFHQIIPSFIWNYDQEKLYNHVNIPERSVKW
ncbi:hypothetical protein Golob_011488 [Gossypium lobatum]|uniref:Uncharacterized protein n=1 Tax=Gossypium lobatum TaxID=34289 RepID=A0A7J8MQ13_9ROSI|nr:hypothetical protein [Gossypium lobatum]